MSAPHESRPPASKQWVRGRFRLVVRIYFIGVLLAAMVVGSFFVVAQALGPSRRPPPVREAAAVLDVLGRNVTAKEQIEAELARLHASDGIEVTLRDKNGAVFVQGPNGALPPTATTRNMAVLPITSGPAAGGTATIAYPPPPPHTRRLVIAFVTILTLLGFGTFAVARWLGDPLDRIGRAARAFGDGDVSARVRLGRRDELGELAQAFDEMADRVEVNLRAERELLANVSHELRTPLARIRTALDIAGEDASTATAMLAEITEDLGELQRLVEDVLTAARLDLDARKAGDGSPPLRRAPVEVPDLIAQAATRFQSMHGEAVVDLEVEGALPSIDGDAMLLRRVLDNLLENAWKYDPKHGPIAVRAKALDGHVAIEVEDHGIGIDERDRARVFRPFFRADTSRTRATGGLGLGLALAKRIVEAHGGEIAVQSALGEGTTVRIELPAV